MNSPNKWMWTAVVLWLGVFLLPGCDNQPPETSSIVEQASSAEQFSSSQSESVESSQNASSEKENISPAQENVMIEVEIDSAIRSLIGEEPYTLSIERVCKKKNWIAYSLRCNFYEEKECMLIALYDTQTEQTSIVWQSDTENWCNVYDLQFSDDQLFWRVGCAKISIMRYTPGRDGKPEELALESADSFNSPIVVWNKRYYFLEDKTIKSVDLEGNDAVIHYVFSSNAEVQRIFDRESHYIYWIQKTDGAQKNELVVIDLDNPMRSPQTFECEDFVLEEESFFKAQRQLIFGDKLLLPSSEQSFVLYDLTEGEVESQFTISNLFQSGPLLNERFFVYCEKDQEMIYLYDCKTQKSSPFAPIKLKDRASFILQSCGEGFLLCNWRFGNEVYLFSAEKREIANYQMPMAAGEMNMTENACWYSAQDDQMCIIDFRDVIDE